MQLSQVVAKQKEKQSRQKNKDERRLYFITGDGHAERDPAEGGREAVDEALMKDEEKKGEKEGPGEKQEVDKAA